MTYQRKERGGRVVGYITVVSFKGYIHFKVNAHVTNNVFLLFLLCSVPKELLKFNSAWGQKSKLL